jgi:hypothetical protein
MAPDVPDHQPLTDPPDSETDADDLRLNTVCLFPNEFKIRIDLFVYSLRQLLRMTTLTYLYLSAGLGLVDLIDNSRSDTETYFLSRHLLYRRHLSLI